MPLSGHTQELSLPDLLQLQGMSRSTCRIELRGPAGPGRLVLSGGNVVDAEYGGLRGEDAAYALMVEEDLHYEVRRDVKVDPARQTLSAGAQELIMEAARRKDEGALVAPRPPRLSAPATLRPVVRDDDGPESSGPVTTPSAAPGPTPTEAAGAPAVRPETPEAPPPSRKTVGETARPAGPTPEPGSPRPSTGAAGDPSTARRPFPSAGRRRSGPTPAVLLSVAAVLVILLVGAGGWLLTRDGGLPGAAGAEEAPVVTSVSPGAEREPVEAAELIGPRDEPPELLTGTDPLSPDPGAPLQPTVVLRLRIDAAGRVTEAEVYRSRPDLRAFEERALEAVEDWRFAPGRREGVAVPTVINWPVEFRTG